jgi:hypothetical protein
MFKKTSENSQLDIFTTESYLSGPSLKFYNDKGSWHNSFREQVYARIDEEAFSVLYSDGMGAPNASVRVLVSMMILKEGQGWSDAQLFEYCRFHSLIRSALGYFNMTDTIPTESTYYLFRKKVVEYERINGENLIEQAFASVTKGQAMDFEVSGNHIRMDSKLMGSNIAWYSRYELVHETLRLLWKEQHETLCKKLNKQTVKKLNELLAEEGGKITFRSTKSQLISKFQELGNLICFVLKRRPLETDIQKTLTTVFNQQFKVVEKAVEIRPKEEIKSDSIQSPHDTDAHYRDKDGNKVKGYNLNVSETCNEGLNLITYVDVNPVSASDCNLFQTGVEKTEELLGEVKNVSTDGAYHSPGNQEFCKKSGINFILPTIQGAKGRFDLILSDNNELTVTDTITGLINNAVVVKCRKGDRKRWRIVVEEKYYYFSTKEIETCRLRKELEKIPKEILNIRNNVEATIFQLGYHYPNDKTRYRGLSRNKMWANFRCFWINFVRIQNYLGQICQRTYILSNLALNTTFEKLFLTQYLLFINFKNQFSCLFPKINFYRFVKFDFSEGTQDLKMLNNLRT